MEKIKVGINGFGRMGRTIFRIIKSRGMLDVVAINDLNNNIDNLAYLIKYDSVHGMLNDNIIVEKGGINTSDGKIAVFMKEKVNNVPWNELGVDVVIECSGYDKNVFNAREVLGKSVKKVLFSNSPSSHVDITMVFGINEKEYDFEKHNVIACSICDVVGIAPVLQKIKEKYGIKSAYILSLHPWLSYQNIMDGKPRSEAFVDDPGTYHVLGRSCVGTLIPKSTSLVKAIERVMPSIQGKLSGMSFRVPIDVVTTASLSILLERGTTVNDVKDYLQSVSAHPIMGYTEEPRVSVDYKHNECSCVIDGKWIEVLNNELLRLITWYDNEWGYCCRLIDTINYIFRKTT